MKFSETKRFLFSAIIPFMAVSCIPDDVTTGVLTDALDSSTWECSSWISVVDAPVVSGKISGEERAADGANWFVTEIHNDRAVVSAKWMTAGLGVYDLYLNGIRVGEEILKPGFTHPYKTKRSFTYDITDGFDKKSGADNLLSVQVTPGWWADKIVTPSGNKGMLGLKCAFRSVLELVYDDGSVEHFGTDTEHWLAGIAGPVTHAAIFDGEEYDARILPGFATLEKLSKPEINTEFDGEILPTSGAEIYMREDLALKPVRAYVWEGVAGQSAEEFGKVVVKREFAPGEIFTVRPGETLVVDFGQNCAAIPCFSFKASAGTALTCLPAEILNDGNGAKKRGMDGPEGSVHRTNLRIPDKGMMLKYTFDDSNDYVSYRPRCTYFGYRAVSITATDEVSIRSIESIPVSSISKNLETGRITTGNESVNKLISNTYWSQLSNYLSVPTDCPQRNERLGWTADTQVFAETGTFFANTDRFFHKWMRDMRDTQNPKGSYPGVAPLAQYGSGPSCMCRLGWADAGVIVPWTVWKQFADTLIVGECWESMEKFMNHLNETKYNHTALSSENGNHQWADWLSYEPLESHLPEAFTRDAKGRRKPKPELVDYWNYLGASYWAIDAEMMRDMALATGRDAGKYSAMLSEAKKYIRETFFTVDGLFKNEILNTMQTPALFALKNGILNGRARDEMIGRLRQNFESHDNCLQTGFLGTSIIMDVLTENGMSDIAYNLLFQRKNPSWLYSIDNGATTIWERWNSYMKDVGMGPKGMNSFNHYAYGVVCQWIWERAAGIAADRNEPGFRHIIMSPIPDKRLGSLNAEYDSPAGTIKSSWTYDGENFEWTFTVPEGARATVTLPGDTKSVEYAPGTYSVSKRWHQAIAGISQTKCNAMYKDFLQLAADRYSVRKFDSTRKVEKSLTDKILRAGQLAPTAVNSQPQKIYVVNSPEVMDKLRKISPCMYGAPQCFVFCYNDDNVCRRGKDGNYGDIDVTIVLTHMALEAANLGIGTCIVGYYDPEALIKELELPSNIHPVLLMPFGYEAEGCAPSPKHTEYRSLDETVEYR